MSGTGDREQQEAESRLLDEAWMATATPDEVAVLLDAGANIQGRDGRGRTPLHQAASGRNWAVVTLLLAREADAVAQDTDGITPQQDIRTFFRAQAVPVAEPLTTSIDALGWRRNPDYNPDVARRILLRYVSEEEADALLEAAPDPESEHAPHPPADEQWLATATPAEVASLLDAGADVHARNGDLLTPLHIAAAAKNHPVAKLLLERDADPNAPDKDGTTSLHLAAEQSDVQGIQLLLDRGADPNLRDETGSTPLHNAALQGARPPVLQLLFDSGADVDACRNGGYTPLHMAVWAGNEDPAIPRLLLDGGADLNARDSKGRTPLHHAAERDRHPVLLDQLLEWGADASLRDDQGRSAADIAGNNERLVGTRSLRRRNFCRR